MRIVWMIAAFALAACQQEQPAEENVAEAEAGPTQGLDRSKAGTQLAGPQINDPEGASVSLASAAGEPLLVNLWATWCVPCVKELPTLEQLGDRPGAPRVIAVSQDVAPRGSVDAFLTEHQLEGLEVWHDPDMALSGGLAVEVLPTTILYDADGREVWRYVGDLDWTGEEAARLLAEARQARPAG
jgi:thiol-disulfide isomerase/thioredoxin